MKNEQIKIGRENRIKTAIQKYEENNYVKQFLKEEKAKYSQLEKSRRILEIEEINIPIVEYEIYNPITKEPLDLNICQNYMKHY